MIFGAGGAAFTGGGFQLCNPLQALNESNGFARNDIALAWR
jgi:hypothetical protein